ncbi:hypothetical protein H0H92_013946, partial [Tricholoma furcatifolium]
DLEGFFPKPAFKTGPLAADLLEEINAIAEDFQSKIIAVAKKHNKSPDVLFAEVGYGLPAAAGPHVTGWLAFQAWFTKYGQKKPPNMSLGEWTKIVVLEYEAHIKNALAGAPNTPENRRKALEPKIKWYRDHFLNKVAKMKQKGQMKKLINTVLDGFLKLSNEAFEVYNFHVFGYLVHIVPDSDGRTHSKMWGSTPAYTKMLLDYKVATNQEVHTWESRI